MIETLHEELKAMRGTVTEIMAKIEAIQNNEASVFNPNEENPEFPKIPTTQEGDGVEE
jgi:hypothetical protein